METKAQKKKEILEAIELNRSINATFSEIASHFNTTGIKTMTGKKWVVQNLFNFYERNK